MKDQEERRKKILEARKGMAGTVQDEEKKDS